MMWFVMIQKGNWKKFIKTLPLNDWLNKITYHSVIKKNSQAKGNLKPRYVFDLGGKSRFASVVTSDTESTSGMFLRR